MSRWFCFILLPVFFLFSACAEIPSVNGDIARAQSMSQGQDELSLLRAQDERIAGRPFIDGNTVQILQNGAMAYPAMLAAIKGAHKRIDMESYVFDDVAGKKFAKALLKRRAAGVEVNLIYDAWGTIDNQSNLFDRLRAGGVRLVEYNPVDPVSIIDTTANDRDHRKLLMIDGKTVFTGGVNISEVYNLKLKLKRALHVDGDDVDIDKLPWRDTHVKIEGPVVAEFEALFMQTWKMQKGPPLREPPSPPWMPRGLTLVQAIDGAPEVGRYTIYRTLMVAISQAHKSIHLTTGFFVPPPELLEALKNAARRGVAVVLVVPGESTSDFALKAGRAYYGELMRAGVKIYERHNAVLHAKTAVIDGLWSTVGSSNLDWRSVLFNNECNAVILGASFGRQMEDMFQDDVAESIYIDPEAWRDRSLWEALDEWKGRIFEPYL